MRHERGDGHDAQDGRRLMAGRREEQRRRTDQRQHVPVEGVFRHPDEHIEGETKAAQEKSAANRPFGDRGLVDAFRFLTA
jgi:hypothetical protein